MFISAGCSEKRPVFPTYQGQSLKIAVIGEPPVIRETQKVNFTIIQIDEFSPENASLYDAVWIRGESNFEELAKSQYLSSFESIKVPVIFEEPKKGHNVFYDDRDRYIDHPDTEETAYAIVHIPPENKDEGGGKTILWNLYKQERDLETIQDVYSKILITVEEESK